MELCRESLDGPLAIVLAEMGRVTDDVVRPRVLAGERKTEWGDSLTSYLKGFDLRFRLVARERENRDKCDQRNHD